ALSAAVIIFIMTKYLIPVSTTQAIVGAIIGWNIFTGHKTDTGLLGTIVTTWITGPLLGAAFSAIIYILFRKLLLRLKVHLIILNVYIKWGLVIVGAFGAYSLGANNIANVMGVFIGSAPNIVVDLGLFRLNGHQVLFLLGGIAISAGIFTFSKKLMMEVGNGIMALSAEAAIVTVFAQSLVLFVFSSTSLSNLIVSIGLPPIPLVPVSSSQVIVGSILGIGLVTGVNEIKFKTIRGIMAGWILTPVLAGIISFLALFFVKNLFNLYVGSELNTTAVIPEIPAGVAETVTEKVRYLNFIWPGISLLVLAGLTTVIVYTFNQQKRRLVAEKELLAKEKEYNVTQKALTDAEINTIHLENSFLHSEIETKRKELLEYALSIVEQKEYFEKISDDLKKIMSEKRTEVRDEKIRNMEVDIRQRMSFADKVEDFNLRTEKMHKDFTGRLIQLFPDLSANDKKLAVFLRLGISSKEIATLLNISPKSVEINRYRLRKKLGLGRGVNLTQFINNI
ncbi:MAG: inorganic phosphate transporter, PiT family, partial [Bacteroidota bacterium]|nr:inorganic phosphate transporter, PiT family [Bacteroidota bacterium]